MKATVWLCAAMAAVLLAPAAAFADGDPASDVLASQPLFLPADGGFPQSQATQLRGLLGAAQRAGVPIRVAVIAGQADLGSVTELWRQPQNYARFLGQELSQVYRGTLLVAMPAGFGIASVGEAPGSTGQMGVSTRRAPLISRTISVVQAIAAAAGHRLKPPPAASAPGSGSALGSVDLGSWLALAAGAAIIVLAWAASLRARGLGARPPGLRRAR
ncbi:MAG TPA: hypothetical protein VHW96_12720 [Solirubrobacteraceae bacterium]|nr:hypothetical protein [Solirubrobacteraceae bacterium]